MEERTEDSDTMSDTKTEDEKEQELESEQIKQLKAAMIAQGLPREIVDSIPPEKLNDPEFLRRAAAAASGQPIPTVGVMMAQEKEEAPAFVIPDISEIMKMAGPLLESFKDEMQKSQDEIIRLKAGLKVMFDQTSHIVNELHAMNQGCLLSAKKK